MIYFWGFPGGASGKEQWKSVISNSLRPHRLYSPTQNYTVLNLGIEPRSPALQVDSLPVEPPEKTTCQYSRLNWWGFDPWMGRSPGGGQGDPLQYSGLENPGRSQTEEPARLQSIASQRVGHDWSDIAHTVYFLIFCAFVLNHAKI